MGLDWSDLKANAENTPDPGTLTANAYVNLVEAVIASLDQGNGAMVRKGDDGLLWVFKYGSVKVYVQLTGETPEDTLSLWSPVFSLPAKDETRLFKYLLEKNCGETLEARFGLSGNQVLVITTRTLEDISAAEISRLMTIVATIADDADDTLKAEFGLD